MDSTAIGTIVTTTITIALGVHRITTPTPNLGPATLHTLNHRHTRLDTLQATGPAMDIHLPDLSTGTHPTLIPGFMPRYLLVTHTTGTIRGRLHDKVALDHDTDDALLTVTKLVGNRRGNDGLVLAQVSLGA